MGRYYDGDKILDDVTLALEEALGKHGVQIFSLLGVTTVMEAMSSPLKLQNLQGIAGHEMGRLGHEAYYASTIARRVALLQRPHSKTVSPLMESIVVALQLAKAPLDDDGLRRAAFSVFLSNLQATYKSTEIDNTSLGLAFATARDCLVEGHVISQTELDLWRLNDLWEMA
ncbi:hypothetical protein [Cypionkella sp. TWP1-2-1b2]|uniref:hypothetical protein n=1 Tax=Cypionkella sp. TWP1-2-1b2 TaxID=2804675 RepID=UPI003CFAC10F